MSYKQQHLLTCITLFKNAPQDSELGQEAVTYKQQHPLTEEEPHMTDWNGGIGKQQLAWLSAELQQAAASQQRVILACHHQLGQGMLCCGCTAYADIKL